MVLPWHYYGTTRVLLQSATYALNQAAPYARRTVTVAPHPDCTMRRRTHAATPCRAVDAALQTGANPEYRQCPAYAARPSERSELCGAIAGTRHALHEATRTTIVYSH